MTRMFSDGGWTLNPDSTNPPFGWQISLPDDGSWSWLDVHPSSWQRSAERLVDDRLAGKRLRTADRRAVIAHIGDLVGAAQQAGTLLSLLQIGWSANGELTTAGLQIAWYDSTPDLSNLATVRQALSREGVVEQHDTLAGRLLLQRDSQSARPTGRTETVPITSLQAFLPLPNRCWTAIVASASAHPDLTETLHGIVLAVAGSIEPVDGTGIVEQPGTGPTEPAATAVPPLASSDGGLRTDFGKLITHRIDPNEPRTKPKSP
jgi:hypothetical protein